MDSSSRRLLEELSLAAGPPGAEDEVRRVVRRALEGAGHIAYDGLGSLLCEKRGTHDHPRVVLDSHLDEVGLMVQSIGEDGRLAFVALGGIWSHVLLGQRVDILTAAGRVPGLVGATPPHFLSPEQRDRVVPLDQMFIDVGASRRAEVEALGLRVGDAVVPSAEFREMGVPGVLSGKAMDNRLGVALMCEALRALDGRAHPNTVIGVAAAQEEVGQRGARTASELSRPDVAVVLECTPADDVPARGECQAALGGGPQIRWYDPSAIASRRFVHLVESVAREADVKLQFAVRRTGGTDAGAIQCGRGGVPTVVIGVPARYIHSHVSLMRWEDYEAARKLVLELVLRLDSERVETLTRFD